MPELSTSSGTNIVLPSSLGGAKPTNCSAAPYSSSRRSKLGSWSCELPNAALTGQQHCCRNSEIQYRWFSRERCQRKNDSSIILRFYLPNVLVMVVKFVLNTIVTTKGEIIFKRFLKKFHFARAAVASSHLRLRSVHPAIWCGRRGNTEIHTFSSA